MTSDDHIDPPFSYRFSQAEIRSRYPSAAHAFEAGDYLTAAQLVPTTGELVGCSLILSGLIEDGLAGLRECAHLSDQGRLCMAFALWLLDERDEALSVLARALDQSRTGKPATFSGVIQRQEITVFVTAGILPLHTSDSDFARQPVSRYGPLTAKYVGSQMPANAYEYCPADPIDEFVNALPEQEKPDFIFALSPQWLIGKNFNKLGIPKVLWAHDADVFLFRNIDNFSLYDVTICECSQLHFELSRSTSSACVSNIMFHPLATPFPQAPVTMEKDIDVLFTGSSLAQFHSEKPRFIYRLSELGDDYDVRVVDGHLPEADYYKLLARARFVPLLNRYAGAPSPRWREALTSGAGIFYPEGTFYDLIAPGCFPVRDHALVADMRAHLSRAAQGEKKYDNARIAQDVNARFAIYRQTREKLFERLLKYAAFMALVWKGARLQQPERDRRLVWLTPRSDSFIYGRENILERVVAIASRTKADDLKDDIDYNNLARLYAQLVYCFGGDSRVWQWQESANQLFQEGLRRFPDSLLLHFNEAHWCYFDKGIDRQKVAAKFRAIIDRFDALAFHYPGSDIGFAYTLGYSDRIFPCYEYGILTTEHLVLDSESDLRERRPRLRQPREAILSACHGYIGAILADEKQTEAALSHFDTALRLFPDNLPLSLLRFEVLLSDCREKGRPSSEKVADLVRSYFTLANIFPTVLLTHIHCALPVLVSNGRRNDAIKLLAAWYRLQNIIYEPEPGKAEHRQLSVLAVVNRHHELFPPRLIGRLDAAARGQHLAAPLTQIEQLLLDWRKRDPESLARRLRVNAWLATKPLKESLSNFFEPVAKVYKVGLYIFRDLRNSPSDRYSRNHWVVHTILRSICYMPFHAICVFGMRLSNLVRKAVDWIH